jgi:hypothetical protein
LIVPAAGFRWKRAVGWFSQELADGFARRVHQPVPFIEEQYQALDRAVIVNCLDNFYGHCLLKLLNSQYYFKHRPEVPVVLLIPKVLRWMAPEGVAAIWTVDCPLRQLPTWNDWLADQIRQKTRSWREAFLSLGLSHPHPRDFQIQRFTRVAPFDLAQWDTRLREAPVVTFVWREDRLWNERPATRWKRAARLKDSALRRLAKPSASSLEVRRQHKLVLALADSLRRAFPRVDFALVGPGQPGGMPGWVADLRTATIGPAVERAWCARYAQSHLAVGVHGSNMLLPSGHAGAVIELVPEQRWGNLVQDLLLPVLDARDALFRFRFLPLETSAATVATVAISLLCEAPSAALNFQPPWCDHETLRADPRLIIREGQSRSSNIRRSQNPPAASG